jgi:hypothetical protein
LKYITLFFILSLSISHSQSLRFAIIDFDNISGNVKYDGLGKAMSSMLISDLTTSNNKIQIVERAQINKLLKRYRRRKPTADVCLLLTTGSRGTRHIWRI